VKRVALSAAVVAGLVLLATAWVYRSRNDDTNRRREQGADSGAAAVTPTLSSSSAEAPPDDHQGFLYGRVTTENGATHEGWLRFGGSEEAFWDDFFNGYKDQNPWAVHAPSEVLTEIVPIEIFGVRILERERKIDLRRPLMVRFGDLTRIEARGSEVRITLKSGTVFDLDRFNAGDFDDGLRVTDAKGVVVDLESGVEDLNRDRVQSIELRPTGNLGAAPSRLHGTVRARQGVFSGSIQWNRTASVDADTFDNRAAEGPLTLRFADIRSVARSRDGSRVTLLDGREVVLLKPLTVGDGNGGIHINDCRYGRVFVPWSDFERIDFTPGASGPAYGDFSPGRPLLGTVTVRDGSRVAGRLVFDLDESETTDTLDGAFEGIDYNILFAQIASIAPHGRDGENALTARVTFRNGEHLDLERRGDLSERNTGILIFADGREHAELVRWSDVEQIDFDLETTH